MRNLLLIFALLLVAQVNTKALELEGFFGASYTKFDDVKGYDGGGVSARIKYNRYNSGKGLFVYSNFKGSSILNFDALFGYGFRSSGPLFFEAGGGVFYSYYFGAGAGVLLGMGAELGNGWFATLPIIARLQGLSFIQISPMIGLRF